MTHTCRFCRSTKLNLILDLGAAPPSNSFLTADQLDDPETYYPLRLFFCADCGLVQLPEYKKATEIFKDDYPYYSSQSPSNVSHAKEYCDMMCERFGYKYGTRVLEIGSNDGYMLLWFKINGCFVQGCDPAEGPANAAEKKGIPTAKRFFGTNWSGVGKYDLICGINVLAHQPDINDFVEGLKIALAPGGVCTMEFPHLMHLIDECQFDTVYQEHYSYFSLYTIQKIFRKHGLEIVDVDEIPEHGGSLRIYAIHRTELITHSNSMAEVLMKEKIRGINLLPYYRYFQMRADITKKSLVSFLCNPFEPLGYAVNMGDLSEKEILELATYRPGNVWSRTPPMLSVFHPIKGRIVAYGAPAKGNTLLNFCGIRADLIDFVVDRSPHKIGKFLPGSRIPVVSEDAIKELKPAYILILAWNLRDEIVNQLSYIREWNGKFIIAVPELEVL